MRRSPRTASRPDPIKIVIAVRRLCASGDGNLPVPTISLERKLRPAITNWSSFNARAFQPSRRRSLPCESVLVTVTSGRAVHASERCAYLQDSLQVTVLDIPIERYIHRYCHHPARTHPTIYHAILHTQARQARVLRQGTLRPGEPMQGPGIMVI